MVFDGSDEGGTGFYTYVDNLGVISCVPGLSELAIEETSSRFDPLHLDIHRDHENPIGRQVQAADTRSSKPTIFPLTSVHATPTSAALRAPGRTK